MRWFAAVRSAFVLAVALVLAAAAIAAEPRNVLVLFSNGRLLPANVEFDRGLSEVFAARPELAVELSVEFLDAPRFGGEPFAATMATYLRDKYAAQPPVAIIAAGDEALAFMLIHRGRMFPQVPVVYASASVASLPALAPLPRDVIGVPVEVDFLGSVEQALRWHPAARRLVVVTGAGPWDRAWEARLRAEAASLQGRVALDFLTGLPADVLAKQLGALSRDAVVFTPGYFLDGDGHRSVPRDAARFVAAASNAPVYGPFPTFIGTGVVGGSMASYVAMGRIAAGAVLALLQGAEPASINLPARMPNQTHVDWRQVTRWGIPPEAVPADAVVAFREPSFWQAYGHFVAIASAVILLQSGLIAALLLERRRRLRTADALAQSERRMSLAAQAARLSTWVWDLGHQLAAAPGSTRRSDAAGPADDFNAVLGGIHPRDRDAVDQAARQALTTGEEFVLEYRIAGIDGQEKWIGARGRAEPRHGQRLVGVAVDITPRKRAEAQAENDRAALRHMTRVSLLGQLSASIAHQLNQPLMAILSNAEAAQTMLRRSPVDLVELGEICNDIVAEDHRAAEVIRRLGALFKRGEPMLVPLEVNELVRDTLDLMRTNLLTRHVVPLVRLAPELPQIDGDRVQLQQLLLNLIVNAADAMTATPEAERQITIDTCLVGSQIEICIADRGPGIAEADAQSVFDPFWTTKAGGMGIGLAICRSIAVAHRGSLVAANAVGGGAVFCARLPLRGALQTASQAEP